MKPESYTQSKYGSPYSEKGYRDSRRTFLKQWIFIVFLLGSIPTFAQWGVRTDARNPQGRVFGTVGEYRPPYRDQEGNYIQLFIDGELYYDRGQHRFHNGTDMASELGGDNVYAVHAGTVHLIESSGYNRRIHVRNTDGTITIYWHTQEKEKLRKDDDVQIGMLLGTHVHSGNLPVHLHLQRIGLNYLVGNVLSPFTDNSNPTIRDENETQQHYFFKRNGYIFTHNTNSYTLNRTVANTTYRVLFEKVDIIGNSRDNGISGTGAGLNNYNLGVKRLDYTLRNATNTQDIDPPVENINFNTNAPLGDMIRTTPPLVFGHGSTTGNFNYVLTSHMRDEPYDRFWNTRLRRGQTENWSTGTARPANLDARTNEEAEYPDGLYTLRIRSWDYAENLATQNRNILIDNFKPYVKTVVVKAENREVYKGNWVWNANTGLLSLTRSFGTVNVNEALQVTLTFSEPMSTAQVAIPTLNIAARTATATTNPAVWTFAIPGSALQDSHTLNITGTDYANNQLERNPYFMPIRQEAAIWSPSSMPGIDGLHWFQIGTGCNRAGGGRVANDPTGAERVRANSNCMVVDFSANKRSVYRNTDVIFASLSSTSDGSALSYEWNFGEGAIPQTSTDAEPAAVQYTRQNRDPESMRRHRLPHRNQSQLPACDQSRRHTPPTHR